MKDYRKLKDFETRLAESTTLKKKYTDRACIVINCGPELTLRKHKYLTPLDMSVGQLLFVVRKNIIQNCPHSAVFCFTDTNTMPPLALTISLLVAQHADLDGNTYLTLRKESVFGESCR